MSSEYYNIKSRNISIDISKGLGIITVVWGHMATACPIKDEIYIFHMALFFLLSGFFFSSNTPIKKLLYKKFRSLLVPYFFFLLFTESCFLLLYHFTERSNEIFLYPSLLFKPYGVTRPLWFFISLFETTILCKLLIIISKKITHGLLMSFVISFLGYILSKYTIHLPLYFDSTLSMTFFFYLGYSIHKENFLEISKIHQIILLLGGLTLYIIGVLLNIKVDIMTNRIDINFIIYILSALGGIFAILVVSKFLSLIKFVNSVLSYLGINSLTIFSLHMLCVEFARSIFRLPKPEEASYFQGIITVIVAIILSLILGKVINYFIPFILNSNIPIRFNQKNIFKER